MENRRYLSPAEFAAATGTSVKTVRRHLKAGRLPAIQIGGRGTLWRIDFPEFLRRASHLIIDTQLGCEQVSTVVQNENRERIPGPPPKWARTNSTSNNEVNNDK
jgi:excisionase family DNA binding protein